jgi:hypothetical protein
MGKIIDMASFEHLRGQKKSLRYTCPKTNVTFPVIYKVLIPDGEMDGDTPYFTGTFSSYYQLHEKPCYGNSDLPGFPPSSATQISTLQADDAFHLDVIHIANKEQGEGFRKACYHLAIDAESMSWIENKQGTFALLKREGSKKNSHILYYTSKDEYIEMLSRTLPCEYVAAFNCEGEIVPMKNLQNEDDLE